MREPTYTEMLRYCRDSAQDQVEGVLEKDREVGNRALRSERRRQSLNLRPSQIDIEKEQQCSKSNNGRLGKSQLRGPKSVSRYVHRARCRPVPDD